MSGKQPQRLTTGLLMGLALLSASGAISIDMYLPSLPTIAEDLGTAEPMVQLTLTGFMFGMAFGQLLIGPISDSLGRKKLLMGGAIVALAASVGCAMAPSISMLVTGRVLQGLGAGACIVLARSVIPDLARGTRAAKAFTVLMMIQGIAPVAAPVLGGVLADPIGWRGIFWVIAGINGVQLLVATLVIRESRPPEVRTKGGLRGFIGNFVVVSRHAAFRGYVIAFSFGFGAMFSYISASSFVLQSQMGLSPQLYSLVFAAIASGMLLGSVLNNRLLNYFHPHSLLRGGLLTMATAAVLLLLASLFFPTLWLVAILLFFAVSPMSLVMGNATALGTAMVRERAGSGSAVMGFTQFMVAGLVSPLVGLGSNAAVSMSIGMTVCAGIALIGLTLAQRAGGMEIFSK